MNSGDAGSIVKSLYAEWYRGEQVAYLRKSGSMPRRIRSVECGPKVGVGICQYVVRFLGEPERGLP